MKLKKIAGVLAAIGIVAPGAAMATNGYFSDGYGMTSKGMAGASTAMAKDTFGGANNPASMAFVGDRLDVGIDWFRPIRSVERTGAMDPTMNGSVQSDSNDFAIPEFGYNKMLNASTSLGVTVYGNGGMNTDYQGGQLPVGGTCTGFNPAGPAGAPYNMLCGSGKLGIDLTQLIIAPTVAYKVNANNSIGVSPLIGYQRFKADGLQAFQGFSSDPSHVTNNGYDSATGFGVRVGYMGKINDMVTVGAAYASKISMGSFDKYKGLFAEQGGFDMPENWNVGIAVKANPQVTVALDYQRINYSGVASVGTPSTTACDGVMTPECMGGVFNTMGGSNGRGFGYGDVDVVKLGVEYAYNDRLTLRAGYSHANNPITTRDVTINIIAPAVIEDHYTLGFTYGLDKSSEITMAYMHAQENSVTAPSFFNTFTGGMSGTEKIKMYQDSLGIAYGKKF
ncbi:MAG: outer membrane protein transport protein [Sulfuricella sp.]|nr:outer membrane protein transport protein [Sulfuricella sp.]